MYRIVALLVFVAGGLPATAQPAQLDSILTAYARSENFNGTVLVAQNGKVLLEKGYGYRDAASKQLNDANTVFQIGSITKQFTAAIILRLQEQKKLLLQDKLSKYFPELSYADKITIENLLSHTSGIYNYTNDDGFMKSEAFHPTTRQRIFELFKDKPLEFTPGEKFSYSNSGYMLLGYIIEKVTGKPYERVVRETIFSPLHMNNSGFDFAGLHGSARATGYYKLNKEAADPAPIVDSTVAFAAGAIYTSVEDLYKWDRGLYGGSIISQESLRNAYTPRKGNYGLGWNIDSAYGKPVYKHGGGIPGFTSFIGRSPQEDICIILIDNKGDGGLEKIASGLNASLHHQAVEMPREHIAIAIDSNQFKKYIGEYELRPGFTLTITWENGKAMIHPTGQGTAELFAEKENYFFVKVVDAQLEFNKNNDGTISGLILHQNGGHFPAKKIK